jgi:hypothetical protein
MDFPSVGHGQSDFFTFQARAFLDEIAGRDGLPRVLEAVTAAAQANGQAVKAGP